ncbi:MAG TPA: hypothetical protein VE959_01410 [Bryobacteraceae bacterium]|nr:hypothetical protein [Bryobacteraceae bacterium]
MRIRALFLLASFGPVAAFGATPRSCVQSVPVATFQIRVSPAEGAAAPLAIRAVNTVGKGYKLTCNPVRMPPDLKKSGRIGLVIVPAGGTSAEGVTVLDPKTLDGPAEWSMPFPVGVVVLVFGPQGLDEKRVAHLVSRDDDLLTELATYANQTEELEDTIDELAAVEEGDEEPETPARGTPADQVLYSLIRALNPVLAAYNPLGAGKRAGPATLQGKASELFFENAGGFVPGGGALPMVKTWLMPDTEFRTVYTEPAAEDSLTLCGQRKAGRNRFVYLWAHHVINSGPPSVSVSRPTWLPAGTRTTLPVKAQSADDWPLIDRVRDWTLAGDGGSTPVKIRWDQRRSVELDLRKIRAQPGTYRLAGKWDWGTAEIAGEFHLAELADASKIRLAADSQRALIDGRGIVPVRLEGTDFEFVERISIRRLGWQGGAPADLDFALPAPGSAAPRAGPQPSLEVEIDTNRFRSGAYQLLFAQTGGSTQNVPIEVLPPMPKIDNLPLRVNSGAKDFRVVLRGSGLDHIEGLRTEHAALRIGAVRGEELELYVSLDGSAKKGDRLPLVLAVGGVADAARFPDAILVAGPRPRITGVKVSPPDEFGALLREGELPAGSFVGMTIQVENLDAPASLRVECAEPARMLQPLRVRSGESRPAAKLDPLGEGVLFASVDPGTVGTTGCTLEAAVETESAGASEFVPAGRVVRLPRIDSVTLTNEKVDPGYAAVLNGQDLEMIEKTGWDAANGLPVPGPPRSVAGEGRRQTLRIVVPWPSPAPMAPLLIWLRGDQEARPVPRGR